MASAICYMLLKILAQNRLRLVLNNSGSLLKMEVKNRHPLLLKRKNLDQMKVLKQQKTLSPL